MENKKIQGILFIVSSAFCFSVMNLCIRMAGDVPTLQKCFFRNLVAVFVAILLMKKDGISFKVEKTYIPDLLIRSLASLAGVICNFYAVDHLDIADASMLNKLSPFFAIIFSAIILKEFAKKQEWLMLCIAFIGALFVMKPSFHMESLPAIIGMLGGAGAGLAYTFVRRLGINGLKGTYIVFFFSAFSCVALLPNLILNYVSMELWQFGFLLFAGIAAAGGQICITAAYTRAPAKEISIFDYSQIIFAALLGLCILGQVPDKFSILGYMIIIAAAFGKWKLR